MGLPTANSIVSISFPRIALPADRSSSLQKIEAAHEQTFKFIQGQIAVRKTAAGVDTLIGGDDAQDAKDDICSRLVNASEAESEKRRLDSSELTGNVYVTFLPLSRRIGSNGYVLFIAGSL